MYDYTQTLQDQIGQLSKLLGAQAATPDPLPAANKFDCVDGIANLGSQMDSCCCSIKTQMLQDKYDETVRELAKAQNEASNAAQSAYLLSVMGKWVANPAAVAI